MQFAITASALLAFVQYTLANSAEFGLISIRSGSQVHMLGAFLDTTDETFYIGSTYMAPSTETLLEGVVTDAGLLRLKDGSYAYFSNNAMMDTKDLSKAVKGFSIKNGHLAFDDSESFYVTPANSNYKINYGSTQASDAIYIALRTTDSSGQMISDFTPVTTNNATNDTTTTTIDFNENAAMGLHNAANLGASVFAAAALALLV